jgi:hypothetical protein
MAAAACCAGDDAIFDSIFSFFFFFCTETNYLNPKMEVIVPSQTLYIKSINERVNKKGASEQHTMSTTLSPMHCTDSYGFFGIGL